MVAVTVGATRRDLVEAAYTLGAECRGVVRRVLLPERRAADRRDAAARARLGVDLRHRRGADRRVERHRAHDHRQPGAAQHRPDHLRDHRHRGHRARIGLRVQAARTSGSSRGASRERAGPLPSANSPERAARIDGAPGRSRDRRAARGSSSERAGARGRRAHVSRRARPADGRAAADLARRRGQRLHHHPRSVGLRQEHAAAHRRRPRHAHHRARAARRRDASPGRDAIAAWCSRATRCFRG